MNKLLFTLFFVVSLISYTNAQEYARGLTKTDFDTTKLIYKDIPVVRSGLPQSYSLKNYAPAVGSQGNLGSCTSWASAYCALTICQRIQTGRTLGPLDPLNLHNRLKALKSQDPCSGGNAVEQAASLLVSHGCPELSNQSCGFVSAGSYYNYKLSSHENLSISVNDFKYVLSQERSPIVISADYYTNGWGNTSNLTSGVWNGLCAGYKDGAHAMVIIGYDDYKQGGAFLVQNSWGTNWGDGGFFWIRYNDLNKVVYSAIQFKTVFNSNDEEILVEDDIVVLEDEYVDQNYRFYNNCSLTAYVTLNKNLGQDWVTKGWYAISSGDYIDLQIGDRNANEIYWMATAVNKGEYIDWVDNVSGSLKCFDRNNAHTIYDNSQSSCPNMANFYETVPNSRYNIVTTSLSCPNISTRGGESILNSEQLFTEIIPGNELEWSGNSTLIDAYSSRIIQPQTLSNGDNLYDLYYIVDNKINHFSGNVSELMKIKALKFSDEKNAQAYLNFILGQK
jgi:hypothetical protein